MNILLISLLLLSTALSAEEVQLLDTITVTGGQEAIESLSGSAHYVDEESLNTYDYTDVQQVLTQVPGVYIRTEDGFGLRPNIGIRGAAAERSQKITLMEDGILIAPAPYSAPAAYYFPNVSRMQAVEVFKGPVAIAYGPHTVGGAINLVTKPVPLERTGEVSLGFGSDGFQKQEVLFGDVAQQWSYLLEALNYQSDGFKDLDVGGDTGFERQDFNLKLNWDSDMQARFEQSLQIKLGYADEQSDETYLGLSDADFALNPNRRYSASQLDQFNSDHQQFHVLHQLYLSEDTVIISKLYHNQFSRSWNKLDGFFHPTEPCVIQNSSGREVNQCPSIADILGNTNREEYLRLLRGESDSLGNFADTLDITNFDRNFVSQGIEVSGQYFWRHGQVEHESTLGLRFHRDEVERLHTPKGYLVSGSALVFDGVARTAATDNEATTDAIAFFVQDKLQWEAWSINLGLRVEDIETDFMDELDADNNATAQETVTLLGAGVFYQWHERLGWLFGIHQGFSPVVPGPGATAESEESVNVEYGVRLNWQDQHNLELIGFFSDYSNLVGRCRVSDSSCEPGETFNGGAVEVAGVEMTGLYQGHWRALKMPVSFSYTYTESAFQENFQSNFSQWGTVLIGDEMPYLPEHLLRVDWGLVGDRWDLQLAAKYTGEMREQAGQGTIETTPFTEAYTVLDFSAHYYWQPHWTFQLGIDNVTDKQEIVSRRPFGARPNKPRTVMVGVNYQL